MSAFVIVSLRQYHRGLLSVTVIIVRNRIADQVQILNEGVFVSLCVNDQKTGMNPPIFPASEK